MKRRIRFALILSLAVRVAAAEAPPEPSALEAKEAFVRGVKLVEASSWAEALDAFERAQTLKPHPVTVFNLALCRRALGQSIRAIDLLDESLRGEELPQATREQALALRQELSFTLATVNVISTTEKVVTNVDGRPLEMRNGSLYAGTLRPGPGTAIGAKQIAVVLDPGEHTWVFTQKGFEPQVLRVHVKPGSVSEVIVSLKELPSTLVIESTAPQSRVTLDNVFTGLAPLRISRSSGKVAVSVDKDGFERFTATSILLAGEETRVIATLRRSTTPITRKWWFYAMLGVAATGVGVTTYLLLQPSDNGGSLNWVVK